MCIGIPMQVIESFDSYALCASDDGRQQKIDTLLVGQQPVGAWLMTFLNTAREVISEDHAREVQQALQALQAAINGDSFEHLIADLVDREPELPDFLRQPLYNEDK